ncbi:MAG: hypothetical protein ACLQBY_02810 [Solirubrobacteraceae bacterium]
MTAGLVVLGSSAASALAATPAACASSPVSTPFEQFGDNAEYSLVPGGSFESGAPGWSLTNSTVVSGNESYEVEGGTQSLAIQPNGVAVSPAVCVSTADPTFRFFARQTSGSWGVLNVILRWTDASGATHNTTVASLQTGASWTPTPILELASALPLWQPGSTLNVELVFQPERYGGAWAIDDVYIDPRMS